MTEQEKQKRHELVGKFNAYHEMEWNGDEDWDWSQYPTVKEVLENLRDYSKLDYKYSLEKYTPEAAAKLANDPEEEQSAEEIKMIFSNVIQQKLKTVTLLDKICELEKIKNLKWYKQFCPRTLVDYLYDCGTAEDFIRCLVGQYERWTKIGAYTDEEIKQYNYIYETISKELLDQANSNVE